MKQRMTEWRCPRRRRQGLVALLLAGASACCNAGQTSAPFSVNLKLNFKDTVACDRTVQPGILPNNVTIVCSNNTIPAPRMAPRFMLNLFQSGEWVGTVDAMMSTGTVTSWRVIHLVNRDYLEVMLGW
jgi:hypothetical protein